MYFRGGSGRGADRGLDRGAERGLDRSADRGSGRGLERGADRTVDRAGADSPLKFLLNLKRQNSKVREVCINVLII